MRIGFKIGKFEPLHKGHEELIKKGIEENDELRKQAEDYLREKVEIVKDQLIKNMVDRSGVKLIRFNAIIMPEIVKDVAFRIRAQVTDHL